VRFETWLRHLEQSAMAKKLFNRQASLHVLDVMKLKQHDIQNRNLSINVDKTRAALKNVHPEWVLIGAQMRIAQRVGMMSLTPTGCCLLKTDDHWKDSMVGFTSFRKNKGLKNLKSTGSVRS
jgi:hypothetical protein